MDRCGELLAPPDVAEVVVEDFFVTVVEVDDDMAEDANPEYFFVVVVVDAAAAAAAAVVVDDDLTGEALEGEDLAPGGVRGGAMGVEVAFGDELRRIGDRGRVGDDGLGDAGDVLAGGSGVDVLPRRTLGVTSDGFFSGISDLV